MNGNIIYGFTPGPGMWELSQATPTPTYEEITKGLNLGMFGAGGFLAPRFGETGEDPTLTILPTKEPEGWPTPQGGPGAGLIILLALGVVAFAYGFGKSR